MIHLTTREFQNTTRFVLTVWPAIVLVGSTATPAMPGSGGFNSHRKHECGAH
jgi:hypothetical protein